MPFTKILFHEENYREPLDPRSVTRLLRVFPRSYTDVTKIIIHNSENLTGTAFRLNVVLLMSSFKMTRRGAFQGLTYADAFKPSNIVSSCWDKIRNDLQYVKECMDGIAASHNRSSRLAQLSAAQRDHVIAKTQALFHTLCTEIEAKSTQKRPARVAASKVLFAILPEVALPVDNSEWEHVFKTNDYGEILTTMADEIVQWQTQTKKRLDEDCTPPTHQPTTLPSVYNVLAMSVRPLEKQPMSSSVKKYNKFVNEMNRHLSQKI